MINIALEEVCKYFHLSLEDIKSKAQFQHLITARRAFCWLCIHNKLGSQKSIAAAINRDHATALHHYRKFEGFCDVKDAETLKIREHLLDIWSCYSMEKAVDIQNRINILQGQLKKLRNEPT